jgi:hypothetical protein
LDVVVEVPRGLLWDEQQCLELDITLSLEVNTRQGVLKVLFLRGGGCRGEMGTGRGWCEWGILGAICIVREMHIVKPISYGGVCRVTCILCGGVVLVGVWDEHDSDALNSSSPSALK